MSTTPAGNTPDDEDSISPDDNLTDLAEHIGARTDDPDVEMLAEVVQALAGRQSSTDSFARQYLAGRVDDVEDEQAEAAAERAGHTERLAELDQQLESFLGPVGSRSGREKRLADIRTGMIRAAEAVGKGVRKHRHDIEEMLGEMGYSDQDIPAKAQLRKDMEELAGPNDDARHCVEKPNRGFVLTTKPHEGKDGRTRDAMALKVVTGELPSQAVSNQVTTHDAGGGA